MIKWLGIGTFVVAILLMLILAPIALGLAQLGGSGNGCEQSDQPKVEESASPGSDKPDDSKDNGDKNKDKDEDFDLGDVTYTDFNFFSIELAETAHAQEASEEGCEGGGSSSATGSRGDIVEIAKKEVGYGEKPPGSNNVPKYFNAKAAWCSSFLTWVWKEAGIKIGHIPYTCNVGEWAKKNTRYSTKPSNLKPGDAVIYGSCQHIGIVEKVHSNGKITTIEGNYSDKVSRRGPFDPKSANISGVASPVKD